MNHFEIRCQPIIDENESQNDLGDYDIGLYVDGRSFIEMVEEFELPFAGDSAGKYICPDTRYTEDFFLGRHPEYGEEYDKTELLICTCGCSGCWPLATRIRVEKNRVIWDRFEQPHRRNWDYSDFGPFVFDLELYKKEISKVRFIRKFLRRSEFINNLLQRSL
ncbi:hypothetical protein Sta7437_4459 [Stanieria cyanosphaera PCC 7437]|uniref:Uncharacterized protein n=1 Tax=Stanieria cyanosphaera (strain ATCC 29371 / PCC 7437) TaxID=111780 RepID=K9Y0T7_STAC7|nr:hypothetical protein [Stanieria cyanosphaera]AFZ37924.1 hypothetical protein Sta7437_4459 [Stanieria cyanosphaera PCC 7437]